ncbi:MAG: hypothetical protein IKM23_07390 [Bacteroidales bacterium]|nr:hypothetical protein [Bacteroidales bacterium]
MSHYKSNGKLLLTGEYLVLKGATALALPLKLGQSLDVETLEENENRIYWNAYKKSTDIGQQTTDIVHDQQPWFSVVLDKTDFSVIETDDNEKAERLSNILSKVRSLNDNVFNDTHDYKFNTLLDFDPQWGLGSSSTLISNISEWADINPYLLLESTFKGSGYDIACAKAGQSIFYKVNSQQSTDNGRIIEIANFNPEFKDNLYFVYQGHKQNSANEVKSFLDNNKDYAKEIESISEISRIMPDITSLRDFCYFIKIHEEIISQCLDRKRIKKHYSDFEGEMKSLGAWGGDFFLVATEWDEQRIRNYFENKGLNVILRYDDIIKIES